MIVAEVFKVYLYPDSVSIIHDPNNEEGEDITSGIINVDIQYGTDIYEGPQQQIDTGQFTIVTRNPAMDPKINPNLKYNSGIKFVDERTGEFFRGYVTDVQVEYQRKDDPIITITGTDIFGAMQRVVVDQDTHDEIMALSTGPSWNGLTFTEFMPYMNNFVSKYLSLDTIVGDGPSSHGFYFEASNSFAEQSVGFLGYSPAKYIPQVGESYLEVINKYAQTNMTSYSAKSPFGYYEINVSPFVKYDPNYWSPQQDPILEYQTYDFSSDPVDARPYQSILLTNGYNRVINQADISNEYRYVDDGVLKSESESFTRLSSQSIEDYAISRASISTIYPDDATLAIADWADGYSQNIFQVTQYPGQEIQQITFDNARLEDIENDFSYSGGVLSEIIRIKHEINDNETIDAVYNIAGISHNISPDKWEMSFTLKPSKEDIVFNYQGSLPTLEMNATSGDSNFNFTANLIDYDPATVSNVIWALSAASGYELQDIWPFAYFGNMFENGVPRTGLTQTWNFDDDGILAPYSFDANSTFNDPLDNRYGGYGVGNWTVYAYVILTNGFIAVLQQELVVGTPEVAANFGWSQNLTNNFGQVNFVDTSVNNETGEVDSYAWDFGDGTTSALQNPIHVYNPGPNDTEYEVSLEVFAYGEEQEKIYSTHTETVTLEQPAMTADYTFVVIGNEVAFTNTSTNVGFEEADAYLWEFGDGETSTEKNPYHVFPAPQDETLNFSVTLTTKNIWEQTSTVTKTVTIVAINASGTMQVRYIQLRQGSMYGLLATETGSAPGNVSVTGHNSRLKARTSKTKANLSYLKPIINTIKTNVNLTDFNRNILVDPYLSTSLTSESYSGMTVGRINTTSATDFKITIDLQDPTNYINDINIVALNPLGTTNTVYAEIDVFTTTETGALANPDTATWFKIGSFETEQFSSYNDFRTETMFPIRPMPLNVPYFYYTITNHTASFTSVETADSYAWTFGDGTTSTLQNPTKTFPSRGTYNVTLAVTTGGIVTRTTTEPVIIKSIVPFNTRYVKFVQNTHTGTYAFDTPTLVNFKAIKGPSNLPVALTKKSLTDFQYQDYNMDVCAAGFTTQPVIPLTTSTLFGPVPTPANMWFSYGGAGGGGVDYNNKFGIRAKSLDASFITSWSLIVDLQVAHQEIEDFTVELRRDQISVGAPYPTATGINYSVYVTNETGSTINPLTATWTKIGDFVPTNIPTGTLGGTQTWIIDSPQKYNIIPS